MKLSFSRPAPIKGGPFLQVMQLEDRITPATFFVDPLLEGKAGTQLWNAGRPDQTEVEMGANGFGNLNDALAASTATAGMDTIRLSVGNISITPVDAAGTLAFGPGNPVSLVGSGLGATNLLVTADTADGFTPVLGVAGVGAVLNLSNLALDGNGKSVGTGVFYTDGATGAIDNVRIRNITFPGVPDGYPVAANKAGSLTVANSIIEQFGRTGVTFNNTSGSVTNTNFKGNGLPDVLNYGVQVFDNSNVTVSGNTFSNFTGRLILGADTEVSGGLFVASGAGTMAMVNSITNTYQNNENGIIVGDGSVPVDPSVVNSFGDNFINNIVGVSADFTASDNKVTVDQVFFSGTTDKSTGNVAFGSQPGSANKTQVFSSLLAAEKVLTPSRFNFAIGSGTGIPATAEIRNFGGDNLLSRNPFGEAFTGGVRVAYADVNGDGVLDMIAGSGPGASTRVIVFSGADNSILADFAPFEAAFKGGVFVAAADFTNDGKAEVVVTPDQGGGPRVIVYNGATMVGGTSTPAIVANFFGLADTSGKADDDFRGGARAAVADMNGDGIPELIVAAGFGGGPRVTIWDGVNIVGAAGGTPTGNPLANFFAFEETLRDGSFVSAGDFNGDGLADLVVAGGPGGGPRVRIADGAKLLAAGNFGSLDFKLDFQVANFFAGDAETRGGVRVLARDVNADGTVDLVTASGDNLPSNVRIYTGQAIDANPDNPSFSSSIDPFSAILSGGVYVG